MSDVQKTEVGSAANPDDPFVWMMDKIIELEKRVADLETRPVQTVKVDATELANLLQKSSSATRRSC